MFLAVEIKTKIGSGQLNALEVTSTYLDAIDDLALICDVADRDASEPQS